jgi:hypothetical protein
MERILREGHLLIGDGTLVLITQERMQIPIEPFTRMEIKVSGDWIEGRFTPCFR